MDDFVPAGELTETERAVVAAYGAVLLTGGYKVDAGLGLTGPSQWVAAGLVAAGWMLATTAAAGATRVLKRG